MKRSRKRRGPVGYMISAVAEKYDIHPQTLRMYEREKLLIPSRSEGNTRLYTEEDLERLEVILKLTRELGVNLAGIEIILNMRQRMKEMEEEMRTFVEGVQRELQSRMPTSAESAQNALVRVNPLQLIRIRRREPVAASKL